MNVKESFSWFAAQLHNPDCDPSYWYAIAEKCPFEAMQSPIFPLLLVEDPSPWERIVTQNTERPRRFFDWLKKYGICSDTPPETGLTRLSPLSQQRFAIDCAEHVLPCFEAEWPHDARVREHIQEYRRYLDDKITEPPSSLPIEQATAQCAIARDQAARYGYAAKWKAVRAAEYAADAVRLLWYGTFSCIDFAGRAADVRGKGQEERRWQWYRLVEYLRAASSEFRSNA